MVSSISDWSDFDWFIKTYLPSQTIPILRSFGTTLEAATGEYLGIRSQERKDNLLYKIEVGFIRMKRKNDLHTYRQVRQSCEAIGKVPRSTYHTTFGAGPTFGGIPASSSSSSSFHSPNAASLPGPSSSRYSASDSSNGYKPPLYSFGSSQQSGWGTVSGGSSNVYTNRGHGPVQTLQDWKHNPMWKAVRAVTGMEMLPDITANENSHTRKERKTTFYLPPDVVEMLSQSRENPNKAPHYSLRIFCTSSDHYRPPHAPYQSATAHITNQSIPIEYPNNPDISLDESSIIFKERGLRGKPGSAPPFDLGRSHRPLTLSPAKLTGVIFGHSGPTVGKKKDLAKRFWFQVVLAEMTTKDELLNRLLQMEPTKVEDILNEARKRNEDEDIVVGSFSMTLKDPLSYMRITRPIRSTKCSHTQCFDATWWIESNSVHPQFLCPLCSKALDYDDLIVDGYFLSIIRAVPDSVEEVIVESDLEWHSEDNKYGSSAWLKLQGIDVPSANGDTSPAEETKPEIIPSPSHTDSPESKGKRKAIEILSSDDEEDDIEAPLSRSTIPNGSSRPNGNASTQLSVPLRPVAPLRTPSTTASLPPPPPPTNVVIDLTLDSSDEADDDDEGESAPTTQQYFHQPGVGYMSRGAVDSLRPPPPRPPRLPKVDLGSRLDLNSFSTGAYGVWLGERDRGWSGASVSAAATTSPYESLFRRNEYGLIGRERERAGEVGVDDYEDGGRGAYGTALTGGGHWSPLSTGPSSAGLRRNIHGVDANWDDDPFRVTKRIRPSASDWIGDELGVAGENGGRGGGFGDGVSGRGGRDGSDDPFWSHYQYRS